MTKEEQITITKYDLLYEQRMTRVETTLENLTELLKEIKSDMRSDFRWMLSLMIAFSGSLLLVMSKGFHWF